MYGVLLKNDDVITVCYFPTILKKRALRKHMSYYEGK
jgi:hypothetical protein